MGPSKQMLLRALDGMLTNDQADIRDERVVLRSQAQLVGPLNLREILRSVLLVLCPASDRFTHKINDSIPNFGKIVALRLRSHRRV